jgi:hypothetical protein
LFFVLARFQPANANKSPPFGETKNQPMILPRLSPGAGVRSGHEKSRSYSLGMRSVRRRRDS